MTVGELARYFNKYVLAKPARLQIVTMKNYHRMMSVPFLSSLSPNLMSLAAIYGYSFLGILGEINPFNTGVGTPYAFQAIMLPEALHFSSAQWTKVKTILHKYGIESTPHKGIHNKKNYHGLKLSIADGKRITSFALLIELLLFFKAAGIKFSYSATFDKAIGTRRIKDLCNGVCSKETIKKYIQESLKKFFNQAKDCYLYEPLPEIKEVL